MSGDPRSIGGLAYVVLEVVARALAPLFSGSERGVQRFRNAMKLKGDAKHALEQGIVDLAGQPLTLRQHDGELPPYLAKPEPPGAP